VAILMQKASNDAARLRQLRLILGEDFKPIDGTEFARMAGIAPGTFRSTEAGLRKLNQKDADSIRNRLGAVWSEGKRTWVFRDNEEIPFSRALYDKYVALIYQDPSNTEIHAEAIYQAVFDLLSNLPKETYHHALFELHDRLEEIAQQFGLPQAVLEQLAAVRPVVVTAKDEGMPDEEAFQLNSIDYPGIKKIKRAAPLLRNPYQAPIQPPVTSEQLWQKLKKGKRSKTRSQTPS
jgi:hypothetical protein